MTELDMNEAKKALEKAEKNSFSGNFKHISYREKMDKSLAELLATDPKKVMKFGWKVWDDLLGGIYGGKVYALGCESGGGKSTFLNALSHNLDMQGIKVTKYSLEDRLEDIGKEELFYTCNRIRFANKLEPYEWIKFLNNEYGLNKPEHKKILETAYNKLSNSNIIELDKSKQVNIGNLVRLMKEEAENGTKVFMIDHLHYFQMKGDARTDLEIQNIMHEINEIARIYNVAVFIVAHYKKLNGQEPDNDSFKDATALKQVVNLIIHIIRRHEENRTDFVIGKLRGPIKPEIICGEFDIKTYTYKNFGLLPKN